MRKSLAAIAIAFSASAALAQMQVGIQRSSSPRGMQVQGDAAARGGTQAAGAVAAGGGNAAASSDSDGAAKGGTNIQGNTNINAVAGKQTAIAVGKGNKAVNAVGAVGGQ